MSFNFVHQNLQTFSYFRENLVPDSIPAAHIPELEIDVSDCDAHDSYESCSYPLLSNFIRFRDKTSTYEISRHSFVFLWKRCFNGLRIHLIQNMQLQLWSENCERSAYSVDSHVDGRYVTHIP